jgi:adenine phosphoribosyltransferase
MDLRDAIRTIPDFPKAGIMFRDVTTLFGHAEAFAQAIDALTSAMRGADLIAGIEARGFILGGAVARQLGVGFVPLRKKGKLPHRTVQVEYALEYGTDILEMHVDAVAQGHRVAIIDDLIATGGTALAAVELLRGAGAEITGAGFLIDLPDLGGADKLRAAGVAVHALLAYGGH